MKEVKAFKCEFCGKKLERKHAMLWHEKHCGKNPANHFDCQWCKELKEVTIEVDLGDDYYNEPIIKKCKSFECKRLGLKLYPLVVLRKKLNIKHPATFQNQELFRNNCEIYRKEGLSGYDFFNDL
jgi:hypothetical protein